MRLNATLKILKWDLDELKKAGIDPSLQNYLLFSKRNCNDCPIHVICPLHNKSDVLKGQEPMLEVHPIEFRCSIIVGEKYVS